MIIQDSEIKRIKGIYDKRKGLIPSQLYSFFNDAHLYIIQNRDIEILRILKSHNITSLENRKILDIGCGIGAELRNLIRYGANPLNLYGIDLLEDRIEQLKSYLLIYILNAQMHQKYHMKTKVLIWLYSLQFLLQYCMNR